MTTETRCAHCRKRRIDPTWRPFCSERCRLFDLRNWLDGRYRVTGEPVTGVGETERGGGDASVANGDTDGN